MIGVSPFLGFPYYRNYNKYNSYNSHDINTFGNYNYKNNINEKENIKNNDFKKINNTSKNKKDYFEIFGLKLYLDDILLLCLIFFLYNEGVKDTELFISLILLLLS